MRHRLLLVLCFVFVWSKEVRGDIENEIKRGVFPFMAILYYPDETVVDSTGARFMHVAVLIKPQWLVSSAIDHSVMDNVPLGFPRKTLIARAGAMTLDASLTFKEDEDEQEREVIQIVRPSIHEREAWWFTDITLLKTLLPFKLTASVAPTNIAPKKDYADKSCIILVYAKKFGLENDERLLMQIAVELLVPSMDTCGAQFSNTTMTCASNVEKNAYDTEFCQGNSGGPLLCEGEVMALQTYIENSCKPPHLYQLLDPWDSFLTCGTEEKCNVDNTCNICVATPKDTPSPVNNETSSNVGGTEVDAALANNETSSNVGGTEVDAVPVNNETSSNVGGTEVDAAPVNNETSSNVGGTEVDKAPVNNETSSNVGGTEVDAETSKGSSLDTETSKSVESNELSSDAEMETHSKADFRSGNESKADTEASSLSDETSSTRLENIRAPSIDMNESDLETKSNASELPSAINETETETKPETSDTETKEIQSDAEVGINTETQKSSENKSDSESDSENKEVEIPPAMFASDTEAENITKSDTEKDILPPETHETDKENDSTIKTTSDVNDIKVESRVQLASERAKDNSPSKTPSIMFWSKENTKDETTKDETKIIETKKIETLKIETPKINTLSSQSGVKQIPVRSKSSTTPRTTKTTRKTTRKTTTKTTTRWTQPKAQLRSNNNNNKKMVHGEEPIKYDIKSGATRAVSNHVVKICFLCWFWHF